MGPRPCDEVRSTKRLGAGAIEQVPLRKSVFLHVRRECSLLTGRYAAAVAERRMRRSEVGKQQGLRLSGCNAGSKRDEVRNMVPVLFRDSRALLPMAFSRPGDQGWGGRCHQRSFGQPRGFFGWSARDP